MHLGSACASVCGARCLLMPLVLPWAPAVPLCWGICETWAAAACCEVLYGCAKTTPKDKRGIFFLFFFSCTEFGELSIWQTLTVQGE